MNFRGMSPLLNVFDMPVSLHFYRDVLGFEIVSTSGGRTTMVGPNVRVLPRRMRSVAS